MISEKPHSTITYKGHAMKLVYTGASRRRLQAPRKVYDFLAAQRKTTEAFYLAGDAARKTASGFSRLLAEVRIHD